MSRAEPDDMQIKLHELATQALTLTGNDKNGLINGLWDIFYNVAQLVPVEQLDQAVDLLSEAMLQVESLKSNAALVATVAQEVVQEMTQQRDLALDEKEHLEDLIEDPFSLDADRDPRLRRLREAIEEDAYSNAYDVAYEEGHDNGYEEGRGDAESEDYDEAYDAGYQQALEDYGLE